MMPSETSFHRELIKRHSIHTKVLYHWDYEIRLRIYGVEMFNIPKLQALKLVEHTETLLQFEIYPGVAGAAPYLVIKKSDHSGEIEVRIMKSFVPRDALLMPIYSGYSQQHNKTKIWYPAIDYCVKTSYANFPEETRS